MKRRMILCALLLAFATTGCGSPISAVSTGRKAGTWRTTTARTTGRSRQIVEAPPVNQPQAAQAAPQPAAPPAPAEVVAPAHAFDLPAGVPRLTFSADGTRAAGSGDGCIHLWAVSDWKELIEMQLPAREQILVGFASDGKFLYSLGLTDRTFRTWSLTTGKQVSEAPLLAKELEQILGFSPDGRYLAVRVQSGLLLIDPRSGKVARELEPLVPGEQLSPFSSAWAFSPDGKQFAIVANKCSFVVWDVETGKGVVRGPAKGGTPNPSPRDPARTLGHVINILQFSPDGRCIATSTYPNTLPIQIWDAATGRLMRELVSRATQTWGCTWLQDGTLVVAQLENMEQFDVVTGKIIKEFRTKPWIGGIQHATPDGRYIVYYFPDSPTGVRAYLCPLPESKKP